MTVTQIRATRILPDELYASESERHRHAGSMRAIAEEIQRPLDEIALVYENLLTQLKAQASIHDYLPILVSKKVKALYRR